jgi:uncharacterized Zn finger protein (UPF0148 family)
MIEPDIENNIIKDTCAHPSMKRGKVWCAVCGREENVDSALCMKNGWPKCCGYTMTIDSPEERKRLSK